MSFDHIRKLATLTDNSNLSFETRDTYLRAMVPVSEVSGHRSALDDLAETQVLLLCVFVFFVMPKPVFFRR